MSAEPAPDDLLTANDELWPFERRQPDRVTLGVRPGVAPTPAPPVRIFLGTEEAQYRAERVFFYSIEKFRDPGRVYEIYLMNNLKGFDRRHWRTGFTNYRYAIPDLAGGAGRAIYNDVDQIYLADPAWMFDLEMKDHGYLAISARDTSVMLIDCARMQSMWNRARASTGNKYALLNRPSRTPGLWGQLDPHWNARDLEFAEGRTKCLHYTALHQQPWQPFPEHYSYHPNPLGYLWHDLEREADEQGYQIFKAGAPSPRFEERVRLARPAVKLPAVDRPDRPEPNERTLWVTLQADALHGELPEGWSCLDWSKAGAAFPDERYDTVVLSNILDQVPPADLGWLLTGCCQRASRRVWLETRVQAHRDLGSRRWWHDRVALAARPHPDIDWRLVIEPNDPIRAEGGVFESKQRRLHRKPRVWILESSNPTHQDVANDLVEALDWPAETKLPTAPGTPGEPGLVLSMTPALVGPAKAIKARSPATVRHVHIGQARRSIKDIDLVLATTGDRLPARPNIVHLTGLPVACRHADLDPGVHDQWRQRLANFPRPITAVWIDDGADGMAGYSELAAIARALHSEADATGGSFLIHTGPGVSLTKSRDFELALDGLVYHFERSDPAAARAFVAIADRSILLGLEPMTVIRLANSGYELTLVEPETGDRRTTGNPLKQVGYLIFGGGTTYRGTPHQQHWPARLIDSAIVKGWIKPEPNREAWRRDLAARGLLCVQGLDGARLASPRPLNDLERAVEAIDRMMKRVEIGAS